MVFPPYITDLHHSIASLECLNVLAAVRIWAQEWSSFKVLIYSDNMATVTAIQLGRAQDPVIRGALRELWMITALHNVILVICHRPGAQMLAADMLSRTQMTRKHRERFDRFVEVFGEPEHIISTDSFAPPVPI